MNKVIREIIPYIIIVVVVLLIKTFLVAPIRVVGTSMDLTLKENDIMILDKISYRFSKINRFDIIVIDNEDTSIIKRVIGLPGDKIEYKDNKLYINNVFYEENYLSKNTITEDFTLEELLNSKTVPKDKYFVLGDNRKVSKDSRIIGFVDKEQIKGHAVFTIFPFSRIGIKK